MVLVYSTENRLMEYRGGFYSKALSCELLTRRYLSEFGQLDLVARVERAKSIDPFLKRVDGANVRVVPLPNYHGLKGLLLSLPSIVRQARRALRRADVLIARIPSPIGTILIREARRLGRLYGVEVVGDPADVLGAGAFRSRFRAGIRTLAVHSLRCECRNAYAAAYVTRSHLQKRYPSGGWSTSFSTIELSADDFASERDLEHRAERLSARANASRWQLVFVGSLARPYKGANTLVSAIDRCVQQGWDLEAHLVGEGRLRAELEKQVQVSGLREHVRFRGYLAHESAYWTALDGADLFVLPSLAEGLPRALLEAMARGLPCIASAVGGIPQLLPPEDMVRPRDPIQLAQRIINVLSDRDRMIRMSHRNHRKARWYEASLLEPRRREFYRVLREEAERGRAR